MTSLLDVGGKCGRGKKCDSESSSDLGSSKGAGKIRARGGSPTYLTAAEVNAKDRDAIVDVEGISVLAGVQPELNEEGEFVPIGDAEIGVPITVDPTTPQPPAPFDFAIGLPDPRAGPFVYRVAGSGFFTDCRYIVTAATNVLVPFVSPASFPPLPFGIASELGTVVVDPAPNANLVRDPFPLTDAKAVRANRVYVRVYNVNGCGCSYLYEAIVVGVDPAANVAVLRIDETLIFNKDKPRLKLAPFIKWGKSCKYPVGSPAYTIGNANQSVRKFSAGVISDNRDVDVRFKYYESVDTDIPFLEGLIGAPILDANGNAVGIVTLRRSNINNDQLTFHEDDGPLTGSEFVTAQEQLGSDFGQPGQLQSTVAIAGVTPVFTEFGFTGGVPFGGLPGQLISPQILALASDLNRIKGAQQAIKGLVSGVAQSIAKRIVRTMVKADQGSCTKRVEIQKDSAGNFFLYRKGWLNVHAELVTTNTWLNQNTTVTVPGDVGDSVTPPKFNINIPYCAELTGYYVRCLNPDSVLANDIACGDIIVSIACQRLGECGVGFYSILWKFTPGDTVTITFYRASENYAQAHCIMVRLEEIFVDFPLEAVSVLTQFNPQVVFGKDPTPLCGPADFTTVSVPNPTGTGEFEDVQGGSDGNIGGGGLPIVCDEESVPA